MSVAPAAAHPMQLRHFRVDRLLGQGGMGQVFLGFDLSLQRPVALKVVRPEWSQVPGFLERFLGEARAQAQVAHPNVVQVYFVGEDQGTWFIALELVDGGSLEGVVEKKTRLPWGEAMGHFIGVAEGLQEAARLGIVHRDIKPANILLDRFNEAHLADFGLAAPTGSSDSGKGVIMGSPGYMAPEQARGEVVDARADIYALGATFYELLSGVAAISAKTIPDAQAFHQKQRVVALRQLAPEVPRPVARIVDRCLAAKPENRYPDHAALLRDLRAAAPRPMLKASAPQRFLAWCVDLSVALAVARFTLQAFPALGFLVQSLWVVGLGSILGASPGQWLMRVHLRTPEDHEVGPLRMLGRFLIQFGWEVPTVLGLARVYASEVDPVTTGLIAAGVGGFVSIALGALPAVFGKQGRALHDRLSGTRVLLDVR